MSRVRKARCILAAWCLAVIPLTACRTKAPADLNGIPLKEIERKAAEEKYLYSIAMPDTWANWGQTWSDLQLKYGIWHQDIDMSSAEELELFRSQKEGAVKDIGDVGRNYAIQAEEEELLLKYKTSYWDEIPGWAKDDDGDWIVAYTGSVSFLTNDHFVWDAPESWEDIRNGDYSVTVGDVVSSVQSQYAVLAAAYAFGGDVENLRPGIEFYKELARAGRLDKFYSKPDRVASGETQVTVLMDFNSLNYRKQALEMDPSASFTVTIPRDGSLSLGYATIISRYAPHPHAAALAREYILSDEGQRNLASGFARPIRDVELPPKVREQLLPEEEYAHVINLNDEENLGRALAEAARAWTEEILPLIPEN